MIFFENKITGEKNKKDENGENERQPRGPQIRYSRGVGVGGGCPLYRGEQRQGDICQLGAALKLLGKASGPESSLSHVSYNQNR